MIWCGSRLNSLNPVSGVTSHLWRLQKDWLLAWDSKISTPLNWKSDKSAVRQIGGFLDRQASKQECLSQCFHLSQNSGRMRTCGCPAMHALLDDDCVKCNDLHLNCSSPGTNALFALPQPGFKRLGNSVRAYQCLKPSTRCNAVEHGPKDGCEDGYSGPLCSECSPKHYAIGSACKPCTVAARRLFAVRVLCFLVLVLTLGIVFWRLRRSSHSVSLPQAALKELLKRQAPILLQMCGLT